MGSDNSILTDKVIADGIPVVFHIELSNAKVCDNGEQTGAKVNFNAVHNISKEDFEAGNVRIDLGT